MDAALLRRERLHRVSGPSELLEARELAVGDGPEMRDADLDLGAARQSLASLPNDGDSGVSSLVDLLEFDLELLEGLEKRTHDSGGLVAPAMAASVKWSGRDLPLELAGDEREAASVIALVDGRVEALQQSADF